MIDIEKFICSLLVDHPVGVTVREDIHKALKDQGLEYKGGKIVPIEDKTALQESKDEKIRKSLADCFAKFKPNDMWDANFSFGDIVAWLEKQSKHQKFRDSIQVGDKVTRNKDGVLVNLSQLNRVAKKQGEQKPTWNGEDESIYQSIIDDTVQENQLDDKQINWLKSLKDRYAWFPSEEQIEALIWQVNNTYKGSWQYKATKELLEQLKKIKG